MMLKGTIYVVTPGGYKTGGTELAHQLVHKLNNYGIRSLITYCSSKDGVYLHPAFEQYVSEYVKFEEIEDNSFNTIVYAETLTELIPTYNKCRVFVWWMSVNNYYNGRNLKLEIEEYGVVRALITKVLSFLGVKKFKKRRYLPLDKMDMVDLHLVQSQYAKDFLQKKGIYNIKFLSDYINRSYVNDSTDVDVKKKKNIILYNPKKGKKYTKRIIQTCQDMNFVPLQNMSNQEVIQVMKEAKVYIDFGSHPGKDRMPREAAMMMCCIITGRRGSANYYEDIPIDDKYKIDEKKDRIENTRKLLWNVLNDYESEIQEFANYRNWISDEENRFVKEIKEIFVE